MPQDLAVETKEKQNLAEAVISTLAFFSLYNLPLSGKRVYELLLGVRSTQRDVDKMLSFLAANDQIIQEGNLFALKKWDLGRHNANQLELTKKWRKIDKYFHWLAVLPFVRQISVINSLALGTADSDSDIDFFVVSRPNRLYFVRSVIIVLFRLLGVYKTRQRIKDRFCFGFFVSQNRQNLQPLLIKPEDPYLVFWLASMRPILNQTEYEYFMKENSWIKTYFPNFEPALRLNTIKEPHTAIKVIRFILEFLLSIPAALIEPLLARIHISHTFRLPENRVAASTTVANADMLKLHGYDVRAEIAYRYIEELEKIKKRRT
ncbi:MAG: hypothetical protein WDN47_02915 [Candidatus Doudnabacteria bacterium]